ncbi:MAG: hypothetical protein NC095_03145 [Muribaculum sp.]|nr:hypothetical protein [Muribaculum sp.]
MIWLILNLIMVFNHSNDNNQRENEANKIEYISLKKIDFSRDSIFKEIMDNAIPERSKKTKGFIFVSCSKYKRGFLMKIQETKENTIPPGPWVGFYVFNEDTIIFSNPGFKYYMKYEEPRVSCEFKVQNHSDTQIKPFNESVCYILDDIYAIYDYKKGWLWSDGKPDC